MLNQLHQPGTHLWSCLEPISLPLEFIEHWLLLHCRAVPPTELLFMSFLGPAMHLTFLTLCFSAAFVGQRGFILWVLSSGKPFLTPTSGLDPASACSDSPVY